MTEPRNFLETDRGKVFSALDNGYENNPEISLWTPSDLAADLSDCTDLELEVCALEPLCEEWLIQFAGRP